MQIPLTRLSPVSHGVRARMMAGTARVTIEATASQTEAAERMASEKNTGLQVKKRFSSARILRYVRVIGFFNGDVRGVLMADLRGVRPEVPLDGVIGLRPGVGNALESETPSKMEPIFVGVFLFI